MPHWPDPGVTEDRYRLRKPEEFDASTYKRLKGKTAIKRGYVTDPKDVALASKEGAVVIVGQEWRNVRTGPRGGSPQTAQSIRVPVSPAERKRREKAQKDRQKRQRKLTEEQRKQATAKRKAEQKTREAARKEAKKRGLEEAKRTREQAKAEEQAQKKAAQEERKRAKAEQKARKGQKKK